MRIIKPYVEVLAPDVTAITKKIEWAGRHCYKSGDKITDGSAEKFIRGIVRRKHLSVIEHDIVTVNFVISRSISHQIVRHRLCSFSQESQRYCNYFSNRFGKEVVFIEPWFFVNNPDRYEKWRRSCADDEIWYQELVTSGATAEEAREVLPNSAKTEVVVTANIREWRHIFFQRAECHAHPAIRQVAVPLLHYFQQKLPAFFEDIDNWDKNFPTEHYAEICELTL
jgi:thymidylate synthase (FAD)